MATAVTTAGGAPPRTPTRETRRRGGLERHDALVDDMTPQKTAQRSLKLAASNDVVALPDLVAECAEQLRNLWASSVVCTRGARLQSILPKFGGLGPPGLAGALLRPPAVSVPPPPESLSTSLCSLACDTSRAARPTSCEAVENGDQQTLPSDDVKQATTPSRCYSRLHIQEHHLDVALEEQATSGLHYGHCKSEKRRLDAARVGESDSSVQREREQVVIWLFQVCSAMDLPDSVLYLTVQLLDRYSATIGWTPLEQMQRIVVSLLCTAMKVIGGAEETSRLRRLREILPLLSQQQYSVEEIFRTELEVLQALRFGVTSPTSLDFLEALMSPLLPTGTLEATSPVWCLAKFLLQLSLLDAELHYKHPHAVIAAGSIYVALWCTRAERSRVASLLGGTAAIVGDSLPPHEPSFSLLRSTSAAATVREGRIASGSPDSSSCS